MTLSPRLAVVLPKVKAALIDLYQEQLDAVILYGSQARGEAKADSDIDILVMLKSIINPYPEIDRTSHLIAQLCLDDDAVISCYFISSETFT